MHEQQESLEQLRALENKIPIKSLITSAIQVPVDTAEDLKKVSALMSMDISNKEKVIE